MRTLSLASMSSARIFCRSPRMKMRCGLVIVSIRSISYEVMYRCVEPGKPMIMAKSPSSYPSSEMRRYSSAR